MAFMELVAERGKWVVIDGPMGGEILPMDMVAFTAPVGEFHRSQWKHLYDYTQNRTYYNVDIEHGWCARYSAPGYMDCTDWVGPFPTEEEALSAARETYGSDDEDEDEGEG